MHIVKVCVNISNDSRFFMLKLNACYNVQQLNWWVAQGSLYSWNIDLHSVSPHVVKLSSYLICISRYRVAAAWEHNFTNGSWWVVSRKSCRSGDRQRDCVHSTPCVTWTQCNMLPRSDNGTSPHGFHAVCSHACLSNTAPILKPCNGYI